jgi:hypothetical protein
MKRAIRRHQKRVAKFRRARILIGVYGWQWVVKERTDWRGFRILRNNRWKLLSRLLMNEPGYWVREMMTRPARVRARQMLKLIENGMDPDLFQFPDNRKPHRYYW